MRVRTENSEQRWAIFLESLNISIGERERDARRRDAIFNEREKETIATIAFFSFFLPRLSLYIVYNTSTYIYPSLFIPFEIFGSKSRRNVIRSRFLAKKKKRKFGRYNCKLYFESIERKKKEKRFLRRDTDKSCLAAM